MMMTKRSSSFMRESLDYKSMLQLLVKIKKKKKSRHTICIIIRLQVKTYNNYDLFQKREREREDNLPIKKTLLIKK